MLYRTQFDIRKIMFQPNVGLSQAVLKLKQNELDPV